jgi:hypothetical protein
VVIVKLKSGISKIQGVVIVFLGVAIAGASNWDRMDVIQLVPGGSFEGIM